jgi:hypothetical protein
MNPKTAALAGLPIALVVAYLVARDGLRPAPGYCVAAEMVGLDMDDLDAGRAQRLWEICNLGGEDAGVAELLARPCRRVSREACVPDAGERELTADERACMRPIEADCLERAPSEGGIVWLSQPYAATTQTREVRALSRAAYRLQGCACAPVADAGVCREPIPLADAGPFVRALEPGRVAQPGQWTGPGCIPAACVESDVREACGGPGCTIPAECRP